MNHALVRIADHLLAFARGGNPIAQQAQNASVAGLYTPQTAPGIDAEPLADTEAMQANIGRCVDVLSRDLTVPVLRMYSGPEDDPTLVDKHDALDLFAYINPAEHTQLWWSALYADLPTSGDHFSWIARENGKPVALVRLPPHQMHVVPHPKLIVGGYVWQDSMGNRTQFAYEDILHIRTRNLQSPFRGLSLLARLREQILIEREMRRWNYHRFRNNVPATLVMATTKRFNKQEERDEFVEYVSRRITGSERAGAPLIVSQGEWDITPLPRPSEDELAYLEGLRFTEKEIGKVFGVPPVVMMNFDNASGLNNSNAETQERMYWEGTIHRWHRVVTGYLNSQFLPVQYGVQPGALWFAYDYSKVRPLQANRLEQAQTEEILVRSGVHSPNEARAVIGDETVADPAMDAHYFGTTPVGQQPQPLNIGGPDDKDDKPPKDDVPVKRLLAKVQPLPGDLVDVEAEVLLLKARNIRLISAMVQQAAEELMELAHVQHVAFDVNDPRVLEYVSRQAILVSESTVATTVELVRETVRAAVAEAIRDGKNPRDHSVRVAIQDAFDKRRQDWQLDRIARTEVHQAQEGGGFLAGQQAGLKYKRWITARDAAVRGNEPDDASSHKDLEGVIVAFNATFDDPRSGAHLMFPGDTVGAVSGADTIQCRCSWVADFSHLDDDAKHMNPNSDAVWVKKSRTRRVFHDAYKTMLRTYLHGMERRALAEFDRQIGKAA